MKKIVENIRTRRLWTTNLFMLSLFLQLILATPTGQHSAVTLNKTQSEQTSTATLTKEIDLLTSKLISVKNLTEHDGIFHKGSGSSTSNITQIERKILQIQNSIQELSNITVNGISGVGSIKQRVNTLEKELEDLRRLYDNDGQEVGQNFGKVNSLLANLTQAHKQLSDQLLTRINDLEDNLKYHVKIQPEITNFYRAMEAKNFSWAVDNFNKISRKNDIVNFTKQSYENVNNFDCYMKLAGQFVYCDKPHLIYSVIKENYLWQQNESYADICRFAILSRLLVNIKYRSIIMRNNDHATLECNMYDVAEEEWKYVILVLLVLDTKLVYEYRALDRAIKKLLLPLLQTNRHAEVQRIEIQKPYLNDTIYILGNYSKHAQVLYCEDNRVRLGKDNYVDNKLNEYHSGFRKVIQR